MGVRRRVVEGKGSWRKKELAESEERRKEVVGLESVGEEGRS